MKEKIEQIVMEAIATLNENLAIEELNNPNLDTQLFGPNGLLDSMGLVMLIVEVESIVSDTLNFSITLADEKAMSQKISPFRSIRSLTNYTFDLISE